MSSSYFQYRCYSNHPHLKELGRDLLSQYLQSRRRKPPPKKQAKLTRAFVTAISGLVLGGAFNHHGYVVLIALNKNHYTGRSRISPVLQPELLEVFRWLIADGYLQQVSDESMIGGRWVPRGYRLTRKYLELASQHPPDFKSPEILSSLGRNGLAPRVELRVNGRQVRLRPSTEKDLSLKRLKSYDNRLESHRFELAGKVVPPSVFSLTRIYTGDYQHGGRYYSLFQQQPSQVRLNLFIDGEPTAEVDYKGLHPSLLYQRMGLEAPVDPYDVPGNAYPRSMVKKAFQVLVNRSNPAPAARSLVYWLNEHRRKRKPDPHDWEDKFDSINLKLCEELESTLYEHFKPISHFFCTGVGLELQHYDSQLVSHALDYFLVKTDSVFVPIHDSFLVKQSDLDTLAEALRYAEVVQSRAWNLEYREPLLEAEVINQSEHYENNVSKFGIIEKTSYSEEQLLDQLTDLSPFNHHFYDQYLEDTQDEDQGDGKAAY